MGKIIAVCNQKGGTTKTTTTICLATGLQMLGYKTLLVDTDPQRNCTDTYRAQTEGVGTLYDVLIRGDMEDVIQHTELGDIIPGDKLLKDADIQITGLNANFRLKKALSGIRDMYDFIIMDTQPVRGVLLINALTAADACIIPACPDRYSLQGLADLKDTIKEVQEYTNPDLVVDGILLVKFNGRLNTSKAVLDGIGGYAELLGTRVFDVKIRETNVVVQSQLARSGLFQYAPNCTAAQDYTQFIQHYLDLVSNPMDKSRGFRGVISMKGDENNG